MIADRSENCPAPAAGSANLAPRDGEVRYFEAFLSKTEADAVLTRLVNEMDFEEEFIAIAGRSVQVPRLVCWYGDDGAAYRYSGTNHEPAPWTPTLRAVKDRIEAFCGGTFNSVLGNLYRGGEDSMGWHADQEKELGPNPLIASLSLGATRLFKLRHRTGDALDFHLTHGSLLLMGGVLQHQWRHCLPKTRDPSGLRINLTFRKIYPELRRVR